MTIRPGFAEQAPPETVDAVIEAIGMLLGPLGRRADARSHLKADLAFDFLHRQSLACELDEAFLIEIPDDDVAEWDTVTDVALTVDRLATERATSHDR